MKLYVLYVGMCSIMKQTTMENHARDTKELLVASMVTKKDRKGGLSTTKALPVSIYMFDGVLAPGINQYRLFLPQQKN